MWYYVWIYFMKDGRKVYVPNKKGTTLEFTPREARRYVKRWSKYGTAYFVEPAEKRTHYEGWDEAER